MQFVWFADYKNIRISIAEVINQYIHNGFYSVNIKICCDFIKNEQLPVYYLTDSYDYLLLDLRSYMEKSNKTVKSKEDIQGFRDWIEETKFSKHLIQQKYDEFQKK